MYLIVKIPKFKYTIQQPASKVLPALKIHTLSVYRMVDIMSIYLIFQFYKTINFAFCILHFALHMILNTFGHIFRLTTFGESHGPAIGGVIDGCPAGIRIDFKAIQHRLALRSPQNVAGATTRNEADRVEFLSGIY